MAEVVELLASLVQPEPAKRLPSWHVMVRLQRLLWRHGGRRGRSLLEAEIYQGEGQGPRLSVVQEASASQDLHRQLEQLALRALEGGGAGPEQQLDDLGNEARLCEAMGLRARAIELYEALAQARRGASASGHAKKLVVCLNDLAMAYFDDGRADEGLEVYEEARQRLVAASPPGATPSFEVSQSGAADITTHRLGLGSSRRQRQARVHACMHARGGRLMSSCSSCGLLPGGGDGSWPR